MVPKIMIKSKSSSKNACRNRYNKNAIFQKVPKIEKMNPRCDFELKRVERVLLDGSIYGSQGSGSRYTHASKERRGAAERKKKQERKKGYVGKRLKEGSEHASGRRPCEFSVAYMRA